MTDDNIVRAAIGRIAAIGDLYDVRTDTFCGTSLLKKTPPKCALRDMDNPFTDIQFTHSDTYNEKFEKLDIKAELKLSILCGLFTLGGSGKYLNDDKKSAKAVRSSLIYNIQTKVETLNIFNEELKDCFSLDALNVKSATHVVTGVSWGANSMITVEYINTENLDKIKIQGEIQSQLRKFSKSISGTGSGVYETSDENNEQKYKLHVFGDIMPTDEELLSLDNEKTFKEALKLMKRLPKLVQLANGGKGTPLRYTMISLSTLEKYLKGSQIADQMIKQINEQSIIRFVQMFDEISVAKQELYDLYETLFSHKYCILNNIIQTVGQKKNKLDTEEASLRSNLAKLLVEVRSGRAGADKLETLIKETESGEMSVNKIRNFINSYSHVVGKINFIDLLRGEGITYIGADYSTSLESEKLKNVDGNIYILFFENLKITSDNQYIADNKSHFLRMAKINKDQDNSTQGENEKTIKTYIAVDLEMRPELSANENVNSGTRICHYRNGKYINSDVLLEYLTLNEKCLVKSRNIEFTITKPNVRVILEMRCPGSLKGRNCPNADHSWFCYKCEELIDYGFDGYFYCSCGKALTDSFQYKCNDDKHGLEFLEFTKDQLTQLLSKIRPMKEMNILILGETGVGKSTWINGLANYMTFKSLADAEKSKLLILIATSFTMTDDNYEEREIKIGNDKNERQVAGQSSTQSPKAYVLDWGKTRVRLIDTPGIGDTDGLKKDKENIDEILRYIANLQELHGICILLKPNNSKNTVTFLFCIKMLLTYLHKSASDNIVFCFTDTRGTSYRPGETLPTLRSLLEKNNIRIGLSKHTMYCLDNESFRFLCAIHNDIMFSVKDRNNCDESWNISVTETNRLFEHISGLKPHTTKDTISLNDARKVIINLTKPLADITKNIQMNIAIIEDKQNEIQSSERSRKELLDKLIVPQVFLVPMEIEFPITVCNANKCTKNETVPGTKEIVKYYTTHCHDPCYLSGVEKNSYPNPQLKSCTAMHDGENCSICGCKWDVHMHIYYKYVTENRNVLDESVQNLINSKTNDEEKVKVFIDTTESNSNQLSKEQDIITNISVKFGSFLKSNAIAPYNDGFKEYLEMSIRQERDKVNAGGDPKSLEGLESMLNSYSEEKRILDKSIADDNNVEPLEPNEVNELVKTLYALPKNGKMLENIMNVSLTSKAKDWMTTYTETHFNSRKYANNLHPKMKTRNKKAQNQ